LEHQYRFKIVKMFCYVTRDGKALETTPNQTFMKEPTLEKLLLRVSEWISAVRGCNGGNDGNMHMVDTADLAMYCTFERDGLALTVAEEIAIRKVMAGKAC
jgi:hypothetical protein